MKKAMLYISIIMLLVVTVGCNDKKQEVKKEKKKVENKIKVDTNKDVIKNQNLEVFTFTNTSLVYENSTSVLATIVTNTSSETQYLKEFKIHVKDENGSEIVELTGFVGDNIKGNDSKQIVSSYGEDITHAASIEYEIIR